MRFFCRTLNPLALCLGSFFRIYYCFTRMEDVKQFFSWASKIVHTPLLLCPPPPISHARLSIADNKNGKIKRTSYSLDAAYSCHHLALINHLGHNTINLSTETEGDDVHEPTSMCVWLYAQCDSIGASNKRAIQDDCFCLGLVRCVSNHRNGTGAITRTNQCATATARCVKLGRLVVFHPEFFHCNNHWRLLFSHNARLAAFYICGDL